MRIVIDMQGAQNDSRFRGIGRYTLALTKGILRNNTSHEIILALNGAFPDSIPQLRSEFDGLIPQGNIRIWTSVKDTSHCNKKNNWRRQASELLREAFLLSLEPDILVISSMFEGAGDNVVTSIGQFTRDIPTAVILYDLIPLLNKETYLGNALLEQWYREKLEHLVKADIWLAISESSRQEGINNLQLPYEKVFNISTASDEKFRKIPINSDFQKKIYEKYNINRPFVMYSGASDPRKNHIRLISSYANLPMSVRESHQLVIAGVMPEDHIQSFKTHAKAVGLASEEMVVTGKINDDEMIALYNLCKCFIFPTWHEGFGLPALEAMSCGAAVIGSNNSSVPEVIGNLDALFDPLSESSITEKLNQVLTNQIFRESLISKGMVHLKTFSWDISARLALAALEDIYNTDKSETKLIKTTLQSKPPALITDLIKAIAGLKSKPLYNKCIINLARCINLTFPNVNSETELMIHIKKFIQFNSVEKILHVTWNRIKHIYIRTRKLVS